MNTINLFNGPRISRGQIIIREIGIGPKDVFIGTDLRLIMIGRILDRMVEFSKVHESRGRPTDGIATKFSTYMYLGSTAVAQDIPQKCKFF